VSKTPDSPEEISVSNVNNESASQQHGALEVDDSKALPYYANFFRVHSMPEEVIFDFGMSLPPTGGVPRPIAVTQRVVLNFYSAKRMLHALQLTIQRYETTFGALETDVQKRVRGNAPRG
jgi:hypothetical protein